MGLSQVTGIVFDIQRMSMHDGPGLRTNVFLKGCPLRCAWCANPESQASYPEPMLRAGQCIDCGQFLETCTHCLPNWRGQQRNQTQRIEIDERVALCPTGAVTWTGARRAAGDVIAEVLRDRPFYGDGGGMTVTGGEPTMQPDFCAALLQLAHDAGVTTALETCGYTQWAIFERLLPHVDLFLYDIKHVDAAPHRQFTGVDNAPILTNLQRLTAAGARVRARIPLIPGFNATPEDVAAIAKFIAYLPRPVQGVDLLPYHTMGKAKYTALGREFPWVDHARLTDAQIREMATIFAAHGLAVTIGG